MKRNLLAVILKLLTVLLVSLVLTGMTMFTLPKSIWPTVFTWPGQFDTNGIPLTPPLYNDSASSSPTNNPDFLNYITATLPEQVNQSANASLFPTGANNDYYNIYLNAPAKVELSFVYEGAGYRNSLGYFTFDPANPPQKVASTIVVDKIIFPNASLYNSGGSLNGLRTGDTVDLGTFNATPDQPIGIGFTVLADGFQYTSTNGGVKPSPDLNWVFYSLSGLNPEKSPSNRHMVLIKDPKSGLIALGMEDMNREMGSDQDFNDVLYRVKVTPESAIANIASIYTKPLGDRDGDGVTDALDEFPDDPERASSTWYPSKTGWNTLAYEDFWPIAGDYDMNDLVLHYRCRQILKADGTVKEIEVLYELVAMGASGHNGFALELTGIPVATQLDYSRLKFNGGAASSISPVQSVLGKLNNNLVFRIFNDAYLAFGMSPDDDVLVNTIKGGVSKPAVTYQLNVAFKNTVAKSAFVYTAPYNPFLFKGNAVAVEIHLPGYAPTSAVDSSRFGTFDDNTSLAAKRYYVSKQGHPWALNLPSTWKWPSERTDILRAYPDLKAWAESGGAQKSAWYSTPSAIPATIY